jgi:biopolymer transport protein ExbD
MAMTPGSGGGPRSEINVTPLVDVVLVLLIIFMVVTPVLRVGRDVAIPPVAHEPGPSSAQLVVRVAADGVLYINSEQVAPGSFTSRLRQILEGRGSQPTFVAAADTVPYQKVVRLMDLCRDAGASNLAVVVGDLTPQ